MLTLVHSRWRGGRQVHQKQWQQECGDPHHRCKCLQCNGCGGPEPEPLLGIHLKTGAEGGSGSSDATPRIQDLDRSRAWSRPVSKTGHRTMTYITTVTISLFVHFTFASLLSSQAAFRNFVSMHVSLAMVVVLLLSLSSCNLSASLCSNHISALLPPSLHCITLARGTCDTKYQARPSFTSTILCCEKLRSSDVRLRSHRRTDASP